MRAPWLAAVLRADGLDVVEIPGWRGRGREMKTIYGVVCHDTVTTTAWSDERVDALLRDGRTGLKGPLSQLGLDRQGRLRLIADGRCNHNGYGTWSNSAIGIEVYAAGGLSGREEPWNDIQREVAARASAAILRHLALGRSSKWNPRVAGHKETDPRRKIDPYRVDMDAFRGRVGTLIDNPATPLQPEGIVAQLPMLRRRTDLVRPFDDDRRLQGLLVAAGVLPLDPNVDSRRRFDGKFGPSTEAAVKAFQRSAGLSATGVADAATWAALLGIG